MKQLWKKYKLPVVTAWVVLCVMGWLGIQKLTASYPVLYVGLVNVTTGEEATAALTQGFVTAQNLDPEQFQVTAYTGLYLTDDVNSAFYEYSQASSVKILGSIDAERLDVVLLNKEAFDAFAQNGFLKNLEEFLGDAPLTAYLVNNIVILEDNMDEVAWENAEYTAVTEEFPMGLDLSGTPLFSQFEDTVYLAVLANTPRAEAALAYSNYLFEAP